MFFRWWFSAVSTSAFLLAIIAGCGSAAAAPVGFERYSFIAPATFDVRSDPGVDRTGVESFVGVQFLAADLNGDRKFVSTMSSDTEIYGFEVSMPALSFDVSPYFLTSIPNSASFDFSTFSLKLRYSNYKNDSYAEGVSIDGLSVQGSYSDYQDPTTYSGTSVVGVITGPWVQVGGQTINPSVVSLPASGLLLLPALAAFLGLRKRKRVLG